MVTLESSKLFSQLPQAELRAISQVTTERQFSAGEAIFQEGEAGNGIFVVKTGRVQISAALENGERHVFSDVQPGDIFGEMALLDDHPRSATASAAEKTTVLFIPRAEMVNLLHRSPDLALLLVQEVSQRLREFNRHYIRGVLQAERMALVGRFASSIVHDLKNPLSVISLSTNFLCTEKANEEARKDCQQLINKKIELITTLVDEILEFTRGGTARSELIPTYYGDFVRAVLDDLRGQTDLKSVSLEYENAPPTVKVALNPRRLNRVFYNLIGNAIDAMPNGGQIKLHFQLSGDNVITEIEDTGPGIAPEVVETLFEAFVSFGKTRGTGLGLSITKKIIEEHHGRISARNRPGGGAIFSFTLPRLTQPPT